MPARKKGYYDIYRLDRARNPFGFGYFITYEEVPKSEVDKELIKNLES